MSSLLASSTTTTNANQSTTQPTFAQTEDTKSRTTCALQTLYLLSPAKHPAPPTPTLLLSSLQTYLQTSLTASLASLTRALATLPTLDRALLEISARCQNLLALETLLASTKPPSHPLYPISTTNSNLQSDHDPETEIPDFLTPLLRHLDTESLPSYFWRSMAGQLGARVQEILSRGGASARTLRTNRERVAAAIRECVDRGSRMPGAARDGNGSGKVKGWEREAAVMVGAVSGALR